MIFTVEETAMVGSFDPSSRNAAMLKMAAHLKLIEDADLKELARRTVRKLNKMTDEEFEAFLADESGKWRKAADGNWESMIHESTTTAESDP